MIRLLKYIVSIITFAFVTSCSANADENGDYLHGFSYQYTSPPTIKFLKKITSTSTGGKTVTYNYNYSSNKLTSIVSSDKSLDYNFYYSGNLLNRVKVIKDDNGTTTTSDITINYSAGKFSGAEGVSVTNFGVSQNSKITPNYTGGKLTNLQVSLSQKDPSDPNNDIELLNIKYDLSYIGNNIQDWKSTIISNGSPAVVVNNNFSNYDVNTNPFATLPEVYNILNLHYGLDTDLGIGLSANNYKTIKVTGVGTTQTYNYNYTYDKDKYPTKATSNQGSLTFEYVK